MYVASLFIFIDDGEINQRTKIFRSLPQFSSTTPEKKFEFRQVQPGGIGTSAMLTLKATYFVCNSISSQGTPEFEG